MSKLDKYENDSKVETAGTLGGLLLSIVSVAFGAKTAASYRTEKKASEEEWEKYNSPLKKLLHPVKSKRAKAEYDKYH